MADSAKDLLVAWLNDAYAMEQSLSQVLENHVKDAKDYPQVQAKLQEHLDQAHTQADRVKGCIERLGESTSGLKSGMASVMGTVQGMSTGAMSMGSHHDELVKNAIADFSAENLEIASYRALVAAAQAFGDDQIAAVCQQILAEEEEMARWLEQNLPMIVQETMGRQMQGRAA